MGGSGGLRAGPSDSEPWKEEGREVEGQGVDPGGS
jgi:hypothetical protein